MKYNECSITIERLKHLKKKNMDYCVHIGGIYIDVIYNIVCFEL